MTEEGEGKNELGEERREDRGIMRERRDVKAERIGEEKVRGCICLRKVA